MNFFTLNITHWKTKIAAISAIILLLTGQSWAANEEVANSRALESLVYLAANQINSLLTNVADNTRAIGDEYAIIYQKKLSVTAQDRKFWLAQQKTQDKTNSYQTWPHDIAIPAYQSPYPAFFHYGLKNINDNDIRQLKYFKHMLPIFRSAFNSYDFSWIYLTTADNNMMIYPYLPLNQALNNYLPTQQIFYRSANFNARKVGWTLPYLDLVGAGMMITASYPIYSEAQLLGVSSHDITINELSQSVLNHLPDGDNDIAYIVDNRGLVIDVSDSKLAVELKTINKKAGTAALFYRSDDKLKQLAIKNTHVSDFSWVNKITERILLEREKVSQPASAVNKSVIHFKQDGRQVLAAEIKTTGWLLVMRFSKRLCKR